MFRSVLRAAALAATTRTQSILSPAIVVSHPATETSGAASQLWSSRCYAKKALKASGKGKEQSSKSKSKSKTESKDDASFVPATVADDLDDEDIRAQRLADEENNASLDVGPNGRPLFTGTESLSKLSRNDVCSYIKFRKEELDAVLPEGLPKGMVKEFEDSRRHALLVRESFLELRDNFRRIVDPTLITSAKGAKPRKQIVLDGPVSCGKSIALAMLVHWAREEGWLVFYVPHGREWTHGGFFGKHPETGLWDTPLQAASALQDFLKYNESRLQQLPCNIPDPITLGEGAGVGWMKGVDTMAMPEGATLYDLIQTGITHTQASVGVLVRLRKELSLVKDIPVLFAIDQYNSWFTFSEYEEVVTVRSCRQLHAKELATVNAFRSMMHNDMMVGAFSHSTAVGKLRRDLPDVPADARINLGRYNLDEAATVCHYYLRQRLIRRDAFSEDAWKKIFYLSNGNGAEMRWLLPFMR